MTTGVVVAVDAEHEARVVAALAAHSDRVAVVRRPADDAELLAGAHSGHGSVVLLSRYFPGFDADLVRQLSRWGIRLLGLCDDPGLMRRMGIASCVPVLAGAEEILAAIEALPEDPAVPPPPRLPPDAPPGPGGRGRVVVVWGTAGAPGRTTVAIGISDECAAAGVKTILLDADTVAASVAPALGLLDDTPALTALCRAAGRGELDASEFTRHSRHLDGGLAVVPGLNRADRWPEIRPAALESVIDVARTLAEVVVIDCAHLRDEEDGLDFGSGRHSATNTCLDAADQVLVVAGADPIGLQRLVLLLGDETVRMARPGIVLNRVRRSAVGTDPERQVRQVLQRFTGQEPLAFIPEDRGALDQAVLAGKTLRELGARSPARSALERLAAAVKDDTLRV